MYGKMILNHPRISNSLQKKKSKLLAFFIDQKNSSTTGYTSEFKLTCFS